MAASETLYRSNLHAVLDDLTRAHKLALLPEDVSGIGEVYHAFFEFGPSIQYLIERPFGGRNQPTYAELMAAADEGDIPAVSRHGGRFTFLKQLEARNLIVPVVGNFAGPRALRRVGAYLRDHGATCRILSVERRTVPAHGRVVADVLRQRRRPAARQLEHVHPIRARRLATRAFWLRPDVGTGVDDGRDEGVWLALNPCLCASGARVFADAVPGGVIANAAGYRI